MTDSIVQGPNEEGYDPNDDPNLDDRLQYHIEDTDDGRLFERLGDADESAQAVLDAFEQWGVEGYYDADEQERMRVERTRALDALREARANLATVAAICDVSGCDWVSTKRSDEAQAENDWFEHAESAHPEQYKEA